MTLNCINADNLRPAPRENRRPAVDLCYPNAAASRPATLYPLPAASAADLPASEVLPGASSATTRSWAEGAIAQVTDEELVATPDPETNSIAIVVKHMAGNVRSRFRDFLTSDGEKPGRNRDSEFEDPPATRLALLKLWEEGWSLVFTALDLRSDAEFARTVTIRAEAHSVMRAIHRQIAPYAYHCGQIVLLAPTSIRGCWRAKPANGSPRQASPLALNVSHKYYLLDKIVISQ